MSKPQSSFNRNFVFLWQGQVVSAIGTQLFQVIVILALKQATDSATLVGLLMMTATVPALLLGPLGGAIVDRFSRRAVLIVGDFLRGLTLTAIAVVLWLGAHSLGTIVAALFVYSLLEGSVGAIWMPAAMSVVPDLVPKENVGTANSVLQASFQMCTVLGQAIAGILFRLVGAPLLLLIDAVTYFYAAFSDSLVHVPPTPRQDAKNGGGLAAFRQDILEGLRYIHERRGMRVLFYTMAFFQLVMVPMLILFPFYVEDHLRAGPQWYGFLLAASGLGSFVGYGVGGALRLSPRRSSQMTVVIMVLMSLCLTALAGVSSHWVALWLIATSGALDGFIVLKLLTTLQLATSTELRGRVFGLLNTITRGLTPLAMGLTGVVADLTHRNIPLIYLVCGIVATLLAANVAVRPECRAFLAGQDEVAVPEMELQPKAATVQEITDGAGPVPVHVPLVYQMDSLQEEKWTTQ